VFVKPLTTNFKEVVLRFFWNYRVRIWVLVGLGS
jgi:hypothetical protein